MHEKSSCIDRMSDFLYVFLILCCVLMLTKYRFLVLVDNANIFIFFTRLHTAHLKRSESRDKVKYTPSYLICTDRLRFSKRTLNAL